jgi:hypothetical protein
MADEKEQKTSKQEELEAELKKKEAAYLIGGKMKDLILEEIKLIRSKLELEKEISEQRAQSLKNIKEELEDLKEKRRITSDENEQKKLDYDILLKTREEQKKQLEILRSKKVLDEEAIKTAEKILNTTNEDIKQYRILNEQARKRNEELEKTKKLKESILGSLNLITGGYSQQIIQLFTLNGLASTIGTMFKEMVESNEALVKATGRVGLLTGDMATGMGDFGVGYKEMAGAVGSLYNNMSQFSNLSKETQKDLAQNAAKMEQLGVSTETSAKTFEVLTKSLKFGAGELTAINDKLARTAQGLGISVAKISKDFVAMSSQLSVYGKSSINIFVDLEKQSKALGIEVQRLVSIVGEGFDTFEGAADKAGKLNAILGGTYLNSVEMLNATESERIDILKQAFEASGKNWESLDRFEKKAIAASLGIKDMNEANQIFGHLSREDRKALEAQAVAQKELEEAQKKAASSMRQLQLAFSQLYIALEPAVKAMKTFITWISGSPKVTSVIISVLLIMAAVTKLVGVIKGFGALFSFFTKTAAADAVVVTSTAPGIASSIAMIGAAATEGAVGLTILGLTFLAVGLSIAAAALGMAELVKSFATLNGGQLIAAIISLGILSAVMYSISGALITLAGTAATAGTTALIGAPGLWALAGAIFAIGAAVGVAAWGMSKLVDSFSNFFARAGSSITSIAQSIGSLTKELRDFSGLNLSTESSGLKLMKDMVEEINKIISSIPNTVEFNSKVNNLRSVSEVIRTASSAKEADLRPAKDFVDAAKQYYTAQSSAKAADQDAIVSAIKALKNENKANETSGKKEQPVILRIENGPDLRAYVLGGKFVGGGF